MEWQAGDWCISSATPEKEQAPRLPFAKSAGRKTESADQALWPAALLFFAGKRGALPPGQCNRKLALAAGTILSVYYCNYLAPVKFTVPSSLSASRDTQSLLPGLGSLMSDGLNLGDGVSLTTGDTASQDGLEMPPVTIPGTPADLSGKFADKFSSKTVATANSYQSKDLAVTVTQHSYGTGNDKVSYYKRRGEKTQPRGPQRKIVDAYVRQLAQRVVWDLKEKQQAFRLLRASVSKQCGQGIFRYPIMRPCQRSKPLRNTCVENKQEIPTQPRRNQQAAMQLPVPYDRDTDKRSSRPPR